MFSQKNKILTETKLIVVSLIRVKLTIFLY
nr:MAG TPA: hypothetical protein [Caudoviricetes sp.]